MPDAVIEKSFVVIIALAGGWIADHVVRHFSGASRTYRAAKLTAAMIAMAVWGYWAAPPHLLLPTCVLGWALIVLAAVDFAAMRLPDAITLPLIALGLLVMARLPDLSLLDRMIGAAAGYGVFAGLGLLYHRLRGRHGLGLGDAKLAAAAGAWLGWATLPLFILLACLGGIAWAGLRMIRTRDSLHTPLPFGVPLAAAFWLVWLYAPLIAPLP
jgi:leader peptidase (prepilin peptidase)/N-methyltransferase